MKESTLINTLNQINSRYNKLAELTNQNLKQVYMIQSATSLAIESITNLLIEKGVIGPDDLKQQIEKDKAKKLGANMKAREEQMNQQPTFDATAEIPAPEGE